MSRLVFPKRTIHLDFHTSPNILDVGKDFEDAFPLVKMPLSVRLDRKPKKVLLAPAGELIPFTYEEGYAQVEVTEMGGHAMVVFD